MREGERWQRRDHRVRPPLGQPRRSCLLLGSPPRPRLLLGSPPRPQPSIAEEGPAGCRVGPAGVLLGVAGGSYLVLCSSSRSQVGSVCPILYSSFESSMLWSL